MKDRLLTIMRRLFPLLACLLCAATALADGMLIGWDELYESSQTALLEHRDGRETLHILPKYIGAATEFAWVVPVPALPTVAASSEDLFWNLVSLTGPEYRSRDGFLSCNEEYLYADAANGGVDVLETNEVGPFQTLTIAADDGAALADSLVSWGYLRPAQEQDVRDVLQDYVDRDWFFVAMRVREPEDEPYYDYYGRVTPVALSFDAAAPVYPMLISRVSAALRTPLYLYTIADRRLTFPDAATTYANRVTADELGAIRRTYPAVGALLREGEWLTKLERTYAPADMDADIALTAASDQSEFRRVIYSGWPVGLGLMGLMVTGLGLRRRR
ncbi:DUF2330 domain-containing protein [bacterium]|nr:DUF2330 domain-containing protein [bacterium]